MPVSTVIVAALFCAFGRTSQATDNASVDFAREVLPILSEKCFVCHGPDARSGQLRLDSFAGATARPTGSTSARCRDARGVRDPRPDSLNRRPDAP